jgi:molybdopterin molybdotransferase
VITADEAHKIILEYARPIGTEEVALVESLHRFLAQPISAPIDLPPFANAAMDGFAVHSEETRSASEKNPVSLKVIGTIAAGDIGAQFIAPGTAARIMTGALVPKGADAVIPFEEWPISKPVPPGTNIRQAGEDVRRGEEVLQTGEKITPRTIALLAALGLDHVTAFRKPRVAVISTGSELTEPGGSLSPGKIFNSNGPALQAALQEIGLIPDAIVRSGDAEEELEKVIRRQLAGVDLLITIGGVSAGDFDLVPKILQKIGTKIAFHKVAIKPGKPLLFATFEKKLIFGLPGNPVSALMVFDRFIRPALLKMIGATRWRRPAQLAVAEETLKGTPGKEDYLRGIVERRDGAFFARSAGSQGSAHLKTLSRANATLVIPAEKEKVASGEPVEFEFFTEGL